MQLYVTGLNKMKNLSIALCIGLLLSSCVSPEIAYEEQQKKNQCIASGGRVLENEIWPELMRRCIPAHQWKESDRKIAECKAQGNYYRVDYEGLFQGCYLPTPVVATQPVEAYNPFDSAPSCLFCRLQENNGDGYRPTTSYPSARTDSDWDWDYQPGNGQWVCRGIQTGQYAALSNCAYDIKDDNRWLG